MDNVAAASGTAAGGAATSGQSANAKGAGKTTPSNNKQITVNLRMILLHRVCLRLPFMKKWIKMAAML